MYIDRVYFYLYTCVGMSVYIYKYIFSFLFVYVYFVSLCIYMYIKDICVYRFMFFIINKYVYIRVGGVCTEVMGCRGGFFLKWVVCFVS